MTSILINNHKFPGYIITGDLANTNVSNVYEVQEISTKRRYALKEIIRNRNPGECRQAEIIQSENYTCTKCKSVENTVDISKKSCLFIYFQHYFR